MPETLTFAVVGHDEAAHLDRMAAQVLSAPEPRHAVFVDSASTDGSAALASRCGLEVWPAPLGKGAAVREALRRCPTDWIVLLDADVLDSERPIPLVLADAVHGGGTGLGMVIGDFADRDAGSPLSNTWGIYEPLVAGLFPEVAGRCGSKPLSGFRAVRVAAVDARTAPDDFGLEAWFNIEVGLSSFTTEVVGIGWQEGVFKYKPRMGREIADGVLDQALRRGRLDPALRPAWDDWVEQVLAVVGRYHGNPAERPDFLARLRAISGRPLPPATS